jgi:hypothetical protein
MLDVHPPHEAAHSWKDFFIHIITIVIGLLIAVGLEQTVEFFHHRHEVRETREALRQEREENRKRYAANVALFRWNIEAQKNNLRVLTFLQQHPGTPEEKLPGVPEWISQYEGIVESVWKNAQQTQVTALMPREEAESDAARYRFLEWSDMDGQELYRATTRAGSYAMVDPDPSHLTPAQVAAAIELTQEAAQVNLRWGIVLTLIHDNDPEFGPGPSFHEMGLLSGWIRSTEDRKKLAPAIAITDADLAKAEAAVTAASQALGDKQYQ